MILLYLKWFCYKEKLIEWQNSRKAYKKQTLDNDFLYRFLSNLNVFQPLFAYKVNTENYENIEGENCEVMVYALTRVDLENFKKSTWGPRVGATTFFISFISSTWSVSLKAL